jgi:hypothetical protein
LSLVVLLAAGEADDPVAAPMARAEEEALGGQAEVVLRQMRRLPSDEDAVKLGDDLRADALVELTWADALGRQAIVRVRTRSSERWVQREITFSDADVASERGRTLGFAAASMLPAEAPRDNGPPFPEPAPPPVPEPPPPPIPDKPPATPHRALSGIFFEALAIGTAGVDGEGPGGGGGLAAEVTFARHFGFRFAGEARTAPIPSVAASSYTLQAAPGIAWRPVLTTGNRPIAFGGRVDALLGVYGLSHAAVPTPLQWQWSPGARALLDAAWMVGEGWGISLALGAEAPLRTVQVVEGGSTLRTYYPLRVVTEVSFRAGF